MDLATRLLAAREEDGALCFDRFMELALYAPGGFYHRAAPLIGSPAVFYTSPAAHPAFGALLARQLEQMWRLLDCPARFTLAEAGAGNGLLAAAIMDYALRWLPGFAACLEYVAVDITAAPGRLHGRAAVVRASGLPLRGLTGCILAHELWDNLPAIPLRRSGGEWRERAVRFDGERWQWHDREVRTGVTPPGPRDWAELQPRLSSWIAEARSALDRGWLLAIDYGYWDGAAFAATHPAGSLLGYRQQAVVDDVLLEPGTADITLHVDFAAAIQAGRMAGFHGARLVQQAQFLAALGLPAMLRGLDTRGLVQDEHQRNALALRELVRVDGFGRYLVVAMAVDADLELVGYGAPPDEGAVDETVPLLTTDHLDLAAGRYPEQRLPVEAAFDPNAWERC